MQSWKYWLLQHQQNNFPQQTAIQFLKLKGEYD